MKPRTQRLWMIVLALSCLGLAAFFMLRSLKENLVFYYTPTEIKIQKIDPTTRLRIGGVVEKGSFKRAKGAMKGEFYITDFQHRIKVYYVGVLPDLFREGQGVVAEGVMALNGNFYAHHVLAKHDENYRPRPTSSNLSSREQRKMSSFIDLSSISLRNRHGEPPEGAWPSSQNKAEMLKIQHLTLVFTGSPRCLWRLVMTVKITGNRFLTAAPSELRCGVKGVN